MGHACTRPPRSSQPFCGRAGGCNPARNGRLQAVPEQRANPTRAQLPARGGSHNDCATAPGWPGKRRPIAPLAVPLPRPHQAARLHRMVGTLSSRGSHNRCRLGLRAPMHACIQAALAWHPPIAPPDERMRRLRSRVQACARPFGDRPSRPAMAEVGPCPLALTHSQLPRTAGRREARGARDGGQRGATHPCARPAVAARIWCTLSVSPQASAATVSGALGPPCCAAPCRHGPRRRAARRGAGGQ